MIENKKPTIYNERTAIEPLSKGETVQVKGVGNSMTPILKSGQVVTVKPLTKDDILKKNDIVLAKVKGRTYMHLVKGLKNDEVLIGNNHGHLNGWTTRDKVYGRLENE
jgi:phage repressor protein C with HTH and peptisase S24 domain